MHLSHNNDQPDWADLLAKDWLDTIRGIYKEKTPPKDGFSTAIVKKTGKELSTAVDKGYILDGIDYGTPDFIAREVLKRNVWKFSVAKNYNDCIRLNNLLLRPDGSIRPWHEFKREAMMIVGMSNRYLKTEYDTIVAGAMMSRKWQEIQRNKHIFPFVKFMVTMDDHTSEICSPLHGIVVSVDDPFLQQYFPPNHFNCRTDVIKLRNAEPTPQRLLPYIDIPKAFLNNVGATGEIFTEQNRYIANTPKLTTDALRYIEIDGVEVSTLAKKHTTSETERPRVEREYENRIITSKALKEYFGVRVKVLPEIKAEHWAYDFHFEDVPYYGKVPDFNVNNDFWEMESYEGKFKIGKIGAMIKHGQEQAKNVAIKLNHKVHLERVIKQLKELEHKEDFKFLAEQIVIVSKEGRVIYRYKKDRP
ncbi:minor capsid protein [Riemerella anatipestifer]|uniref:phage head morphogenesis protein n=1 Tax=Riemerella anatipestifer TaxID=34085 RepID=UPI002B2F8057|nr:minor capsid protein [Riemerella anatipestifer]WPC11213.1 minor capsid protein [Riemerella anatipestifer]WPC11591.1 minor capsid protein [Riemerella anatipestifer]WPC12713.1 minor capsid protein [Riemerella anatipestifer]WPC13115.1 minor capsid protein [Riemerella anatipestifer]